MAVVGLVAGILAVAASFFYSIIIGGSLALVALVSGGIAKGRAETKGAGGEGLANAGMVLAGISIIINIVVPMLD